MARIGIIGSEGAMGHALASVIAAGGHALSGGVDKGGDPAGLADESDVLVDFSSPQALEANLHAAIGAGIPLVIGTTGLDATHHTAIDNAARVVPILQTGNTSLGVTLLAHLVREAAARLGPDWDIEIVEMHHRRKVDAPSGTALLLGEAAAQGRGIELAANRESGRDGHTGARRPGTIGFASLRGGTVAGEHSVILAGEQERLVLAHSAEDRSIFARGAIRAAEWLIGKPARRYTMEDVLEL
ncbi:4-hydroxy-tetrahydrodipicolinate reductase [Erythrobacter mangrovi]|uniref:4-hydroxy-tetrahydrodipicolinate reductase n=1 Tax=Erythrobacter mangrovi TaxID=2739433 RepID=A0A7D3XBB5_9SPHN|nr:4-hydroxy-tetrahydrodipicolinate reductase [Erythrobacter mangrovi]QKG72395.1 4-hydroxy-tetrahydrodipicolinate reductase [Erythrobacter mangrovi]